MKSHTKHLKFHVPERRAFINITQEVRDEVRSSGVQEGLCLVNAMHITASVFINDDERARAQEISDARKALVDFPRGLHAPEDLLARIKQLISLCQNIAVLRLRRSGLISRRMLPESALIFASSSQVGIPSTQ